MENKPKQSLLKNLWILGALIIIVVTLLLLNLTGYINLHKINFSSFGNQNNLSSTTIKTIPATVPTSKTSIDVKISFLTCSLSALTADWGDKIYYVRAIATGTAEGPVGVRVELPLLIWSTDKWDCGTWTYSPGALIAVGGTCVRNEGQPEITSWTVDTGGEEQGDWLKGKSRSYGAKIYLKGDLEPQKSDSQSTICQ